MRRLSHTSTIDERGAVAIVVAILMVVLLGMGALVIDIAALFQERRELQNGADAAALAIAADCVEGLPSCAVGAASELVAGSYADDNADDDVSTVDSVDLDLDAQQVTVVTSTETSGGGTQILYKLAGVIPGNFVGDTVGASATATWGAAGGLSHGFPIVISACEYELHTTDGTVFTESPYTGTPSVIDLHSGTGGDETPCPYGPAGMDVNDDGEVLPAGFGWLENVDCEVSTTAVGDSDWVTKDSGVNPECDDAELAARLGTVVDLPVFGDFCRGNEPEPDCPGFNNRDKYEIYTYTGFYLTGYQFPGSTGHASGFSDPDCNAVGNSGSCIAGFFVRHIASGGTTGGNVPGGLSTISLIS